MYLGRLFRKGRAASRREETMDKKKQVELLAKKLAEMGLHTQAEVERQLKQSVLDIAIFTSTASEQKTA